MIPLIIEILAHVGSLTCRIIRSLLSWLALRSSLEFRILAGTGSKEMREHTATATPIASKRDFSERKSRMVSSVKEIPVLSGISETMESMGRTSPAQVSTREKKGCISLLLNL